MRTHPLGVIFLLNPLEQTFRVAAQISRTTHVDPRCVVSCCLVTALVRGVLRGEVMCEEDIDRLIEAAFQWVDAQAELRCPEKGIRQEECPESLVAPDVEEGDDHSHLGHEEYRRHVYARTLEELQLDDAQKMGYVYKCLGAAVLLLRLAMRHGRIVPDGGGLFESLVTRLVMYGGDADTNACVAGALLGAWVGYSHLPPHWRDGIAYREWLLRKSESLSSQVGVLERGADTVRREDCDNENETAPDGGKGLLSKEDLDKRAEDWARKIMKKGDERRLAKERAQREAGAKKWYRRLSIMR
ncbi:ADP-ribosylation/Crystallin J1 [Macrophomina phaseolina MS6]|uniref:ADP-ribosylation/Crystallin J1 n=1 Tax=Macrophomina phaseolina (strain MS6) TaxID=1126212 RepID=K2SJA6_MACPH|nr:ADP-ribosylation/Crystallin J1 [Macrophomina phaseolina MS6]